MKLKPEGSLALGLATVVVVYATYEHMLPTMVEHRIGQQGDKDAAAAERLATVTSAGIVSGISLLAKDPTVFILGGAATVALAWMHKHANVVSPLTQFASGTMAGIKADAAAAVDAGAGYDDSMVGAEY